MERKIQRGDLFYADLKIGVGSEQSGKRPILIIQNDVGNKYSGTVIVAAITSKTEGKQNMPTHCRLQAQYGLARVSYILLEQIQTIDKARLNEYIGKLSKKAIRRANRALAVSVGLE